MGIAVMVIVFLVVGLWGVASIGRSVQKAQGRGNCAYCHARLAKVGAGYAAACRKCGRSQPWAEGSV